MQAQHFFLSQAQKIGIKLRFTGDMQFRGIVNNAEGVTLSASRFQKII